MLLTGKKVQGITNLVGEIQRENSKALPTRVLHYILSYMCSTCSRLPRVMYPATRNQPMRHAWELSKPARLQRLQSHFRGFEGVSRTSWSVCKLHMTSWMFIGLHRWSSYSISDMAPRGGLVGAYMMGVPLHRSPMPLSVLHWTRVVIVVINS